MQLNRFTDLGLRVLMYLSQPAREVPFTIAAMAQELAASEHHLVKVVHFMGKQGWIRTMRGKGGGVSLAHPTSAFQVGQVVRTLENHAQNQNQLVDCYSQPCVLLNHCLLKPALDRALEAFFQYLDQYTLAQMMRSPLTANDLLRIPTMNLTEYYEI